MKYLCLPLYGGDCNAIETAWCLFSNLVFSGVFYVSGSASQVKYKMKFVFRVGAALRKDLHEVCKAESTTEVGHLCQPSQSFSRSVGHTAVQKSQTPLSLWKQ